MFTGRSTLRKPEKKEPTERDKQLQAYLAGKYGVSADDGQEAPKKKKKKKPKAAPVAVKILEGDVTGFADVSDAVARPLKLEEEPDEEDGGQQLVCCVFSPHAIGLSQLLIPCAFCR